MIRFASVALALLFIALPASTVRVYDDADVAAQPHQEQDTVKKSMVSRAQHAKLSATKLDRALQKKDCEKHDYTCCNCGAKNGMTVDCQGGYHRRPNCECYDGCP